MMQQAGLSKDQILGSLTESFTPRWVRDLWDETQERPDLDELEPAGCFKVTSPVGNTGGKFLEKLKDPKARKELVKLDWVNATLKLPPHLLTVSGKVESLDPDPFVYVSEVFRDELELSLEVVPGKVLFYDYKAIIYRQFGEDEKTRLNMGYLGWGGQAETVLLSINSMGCSYLDHYQASVGFSGVDVLYYFLEQCKETTGYGRLTRVDIAFDDFEGNTGLGHVFDMYERGLFSSGRGRAPSYRINAGGVYGKRTVNQLLEDADNEKGNTLYIGSRQSSRMLRAYEKGKQLGDPSSPWVRLEVEFKNKDIDIPLAALQRPAEYFRGAYMALDELFVCDEPKQVLESIKKQKVSTVKKAVHYARVQYGMLVNYLLEAFGGDAYQVVDVLKRDEKPKFQALDDYLGEFGQEFRIRWDQLKTLARDEFDFCDALFSEGGAVGCSP